MVSVFSGTFSGPNSLGLDLRMAIKRRRTIRQPWLAQSRSAGTAFPHPQPL
jgi:hypothetical protein